MPVAPGQTIDVERTRTKVLRSATELFYLQGLHATGVNDIAAHAGVSKLSLYRHFGSKEALIQAVLLERSARVGRWLREAAKRPRDPRRRLLAVFDALRSWYEEPGFRGCAIVRAASESGEGGMPSEIAERHLTQHRELLTALARNAGCRDAPRLARQLLILIEGATVVASITDDPRAAVDARAVAERLIESASGERRRGESAKADGDG